MVSGSALTSPISFYLEYEQANSILTTNNYIQLPTNTEETSQQLGSDCIIRAQCAKINNDRYTTVHWAVNMVISHFKYAGKDLVDPVTSFGKSLFTQVLCL